MRETLIHVLAFCLLLFSDSAAHALVGVDLGTPGIPGSYTDEGGGAFTITAGGDDVWNTSDNGYFAYEEITGDMSITAQVVGFTGGTNAWSKGAVMIRDTLDGDSANLANIVARNNPNNDQVRFTAGATTSRSNPRPPGTGVGQAPWVRLTRDGDVFSFSYSADGVDWLDYPGTQTVAMTDSVFVGIAATAHDDAQSTTVRFENVDIVQIPRLTWDELGSDTWASASWLGGPPASPDASSRAVLEPANTNTVTIAADATALSLTVNGGGIAIAAGQTLSVANGADFADGTSLGLGTGATLSAAGGTLPQIVGAGDATIDVAGGTMISVGFSDGGTAGTFAKTGAGTLTLTNLTGSEISATAASVFNIAGGTLEASGLNPLGDAQQLTLSGGTFKFNGQHTLGLAPAGPVTHWAFDEGAGLAAVNSANPGTHDGVLTNFVGDDSQWVDGRIGTAIEFDGVDDFVDITDWQGISGTTARTLSAWIKTTKDDAEILTWGINSAGEKWHFRTQTSNGQDGAIRVEVNGGYIVGSTDVRDDQWHHVAAVLPDGADNVNEMTLYVDGQPELVSASQGEPINTAVGDNVQVGLGHNNRPFEGSIDDIYVYDRALSDAEVESIFGVVAVPDMASTNVLVTADSVLESGVRAETAFGTLTMQGGLLTTAGRGPIRFAGTLVPNTGGPVTVAFDAQVPTDFGGIDADRGEVTIAKAGTGTWLLDADPVINAANSDWRVDDGTLELSGTAPLGGRPITVAGGILKATTLDGSSLTLAGGTASFRDTPSPGAGPAGAVANWKFDETSGLTAVNSANPGVNDGALINFTDDDSQWVDGVDGGALYLDGTDDWVDGGASSIVTGPYTVAMWVKADSLVHDSVWDPTFAGGDSSTGGSFQIDVGSTTNGIYQYRADDNIDMGPVETDWVHIAATYDSTTVRTYYNGDFANSAVTTSTDLVAYYIGRNRNLDRKLDSAIDDVYIYDRALADGEIAAMFGTSTAPDVAGLDVTVTEDSVLEVKSAFDVPFGPLTMVNGALTTSGRGGVSFSGTTIPADATSVGFDPQIPTDYGTIDANGADVTVAKTGPSTWTVDAATAPINLGADATWEVRDGALKMVGDGAWAGVDSAVLSGGTLVIQGDSAPVVPAGASAHYSFDSAFAPGIDATGNGHNGAAEGDPAYVAAGRAGGAFDFDGDDGVNLNGGDFLEDAASERTVAFWMNQSDATGEQLMFDEGGATNGLGVAAAEGVLQARIMVNPDATDVVDTVALTAGWHHVAAVFGDSTYTLYLDGSEVASAATVFTGFPTHTNDPGIGFKAGGENTFGTAGGFLGLLDEVYVYETALEAADIVALRDAADFVSSDLDMTDKDFTVTGDATLSVPTGGAASLGPLSLQSGVLTTAGAAGGISFTGTTIDGVDGAVVGVNPLATSDLGVLTGDGVTPVTFRKEGPGDLVLSQQPVGLDAVTFEAAGGRLVGVASAAASPLGSASASLNGGELVLGNADAGVDVGYDNALAVDSDSVLTAGSGGAGAAGPLTVSVGSPANGLTLNNQARLTLTSTDDYTLDVAGPLGGSGTLSVADGSVALSGGGSATGIDVSGGALHVGADVNVQALTVTGGAVSTNGSQVVISDRLKIGEVPYRIDTGTFGASGADLMAGVDLALGGGTLSVGAPTAGPADPAAYWSLDELAGATLAGDSGPNGYTGTVTDAVSGEEGIIGNAFRFDGDNDYVDFGPAVAEMQAPASFSVAMWFNRQTDSTGGGNDTNHVVNNVLMAQSGQSGNDNFELGTETDVVQLYVDHSGGGGLPNERYFATVPEGIANDEWHHVAVTYDSGVSPSLKVYFNGGLLQEWAEPNGALAARTNNSSVALGVARTDRGDPWGDFDGFMDEVYLFDRSLTGEEVSQLFTAPDSGMVLDLPTTNMMVSADTVLDLQTLDDATFGNLQLDAGVELTIDNVAASFKNVTAGDGASIVGDLLLRGAIEPSTSGALMSIDGELEMEDDAGYVAKVNGAANDVLALTGDAFVGGTLTVQGLGSLPDVGDTSRTILMTEGESAIDGTFSDTPDVGDHLGSGIFASDQGPNGQVVTYSDTAIDVDLFQAIAGDTDGNRDVNGFDIQAILAANKFGTPLPADWTEGDFTNDGVVNGFDIQAILAANKFGTGPYAAAEGGVNAVPEPGTIAMLLTGLAGLVLLAVRRRRRA